jgi:uncharacterized protein
VVSRRGKNGGSEQRMRYADEIERTLYNVVATSPALDGSGFFYANPLHQRVPGEAPDPDAESPRAASSLRAPWFHVSCCPTNVARTFASLADYVATSDEGGVQLHQLGPCTLRSGDVRLRVITGYPWGGEVVVRVEETVRGCVAVERGPIVYCLESTDQDPAVSLSEVLTDASDGLADAGTDESLGGATVIESGGRRFDGSATSLRFIPYHAWGNRGLSTMRVWVPEA